MLEADIRIFLRHLQRRIHIAQGGGENQLVAGAYQLFDRALGVRTLGDIFQERRLDGIAEFFRNRLASQFVLLSPAEIADRTKIDKADL
jgi:hypothetical protein